MSQLIQGFTSELDKLAVSRSLARRLERILNSGDSRARTYAYLKNRMRYLGHAAATSKALAKRRKHLRDLFGFEGSSQARIDHAKDIAKWLMERGKEWKNL